MTSIKFRPHAVVTYYNGSREAVAVDFTPLFRLTLTPSSARWTAGALLILWFKYSAKVWRFIASLFIVLMKIYAGIVLCHRQEAASCN